VALAPSTAHDANIQQTLLDYKVIPFAEPGSGSAKPME
jgi:hypothetical protein